MDPGCRGAVRAAAAVLVLALCLGACTDDSDQSGPPADPIEPTSLRTLEAPWSGAGDEVPSWGGSVTPLGSDRVLTTIWEGGERTEFAVADLDDGSWEDVDPPPESDEGPFLSIAGNEVASLQPVALDGDIYLPGGRCEAFNLGTEEEPVCASPGDYEVWKLEDGGSDWELTMSASFEDLIGEDRWASTRVLGVSDGRIVALLWPEPSLPEHPIVAIDPESGDVEQIGEFVQDERNATPLCATADGTVFGASFDDTLASLSGEGDWAFHEQIDLHTSTAALVTGRSGWMDFSDQLVCGDRSAFVLRNDLEGQRLVWEEVDPSGQMVHSGEIALDSVYPTWIPECVADGVGGPEDFTYATGNEVGVVQEFTDPDPFVRPSLIEDPVVDGGEVIPPECDARTGELVVIPALDEPPLAQAYPSDPSSGDLRRRLSPALVRDATRLPDGRVVVLVWRQEHQGEPSPAAADTSVTVELLIAE